jgi:phospholipid/cholesterol/gamma-HCH transport system substrate-binding protein
MKAAQYKRAIIVGIFIFLSIAILMAGVLVIGNKRRTFAKTITVKSIFDNVNGLQDGNNIWYSEVRVGIVKKIELINNAQVAVEMKIDKNSRDFIHKDAKAKIGSDGLIGNKIIIIYGGTPGIAAINDGDMLQVEKPLNSEDVMNTLQENNKNLLSITTDLKVVSRKLAEGQGTIGSLLTDETLANQLQATVATLQRGSANMQMFASNLADYTSKLQSKGALENVLIKDNVFFNRLRSSALQIQQASNSAKEFTKNLEDVSYNLKDSSNLAGVLFHDRDAATNMRTTVENLRAGTKKFDEDMEALQHNFLFRGFFRKRAKQQQQQQAQQKNQTVSKQ